MKYRASTVEIAMRLEKTSESINIQSNLIHGVVNLLMGLLDEIRLEIIPVVFQPGSSRHGARPISIIEFKQPFKSRRHLIDTVLQLCELIRKSDPFRRVQLRVNGNELNDLYENGERCESNNDAESGRKNRLVHKRTNLMVDTGNNSIN